MCNRIVWALILLVGCVSEATPTTPDAAILPNGRCPADNDIGILYETASTTQPNGWQEESVYTMLPANLEDLIVLPGVGSDGKQHAILISKNFTP